LQEAGQHGTSLAVQLFCDAIPFESFHPIRSLRRIVTRHRRLHDYLFLLIGFLTWSTRYCQLIKPAARRHSISCPQSEKGLCTTVLNQKFAYRRAFVAHRQVACAEKFREDFPAMVTRILWLGNVCLLWSVLFVSAFHPAPVFAATNTGPLHCSPCSLAF